MDGGHTKNAALTTALAFHYQVLIGIDKCFSLREGQAIWFEKDGDVSLCGEGSSPPSQIEVKHYIEPLTDHHENLWKTLKNWLAPEFDHNQYVVLVLHTTQPFGLKTVFKRWNSKSAEQRLELLEKVFNSRPEKERTSDKPAEIIGIQKAVIEADRSTLLDVLEKVTLYTEAEKSEELKERIAAFHPGIPKSNQDSYLQGLIGFVYTQANQMSWAVSYASFHVKCQELTSLLCKRTYTFPPFIGYEASDSDIESHQDKLFIQKIYEIEHDEMVPDALGNRMELQNSLMKELDEYPLYASKTKSYQNKLVKRFKLSYSNARLEVVNSIKSSKFLYNDTMRELPLNMDNDTPPIEYKNGLIHDAMDDNKRQLTWKVVPYE